ncbi:MAG: hypothetical protein HQL27_04750 [Candidatus Omnitrophica bacterium]|nr:hypothetical protein [Candidatus Omnitrophota bacterium]
MGPRLIDAKQRRNEVLSIVVEEYIKTISPVGSNFISTLIPYEISSATVRNILAELEEDGYLTHPHTSAGRLPTEKGYRYYVDFLMREIELLEEEKSNIRRQYEEQTKELEILLERTSRVLSDMTHYTSIISLDDWGNKIIFNGMSFIAEHPEYYQNFASIKRILHALDEKERILKLINGNLARKIEIYIGAESAYNDISDCSLAVSRYKTRNGLSGRIALLGPTCMNYKKVVSALDYMSGLMEDLL